MNKVGETYWEGYANGMIFVVCSIVKSASLSEAMLKCDRRLETVKSMTNHKHPSFVGYKDGLVLATEAARNAVCITS